MSDLVTFLLDRISEDEAVARMEVDHPFAGPLSLGWVEYGPGSALTVDPARVLVECETKRRILRRCQESNGYWGYDVERLLALPYADHPEFRGEEWA